MGKTVTPASIEEKIDGVYYLNVGVALDATNAVLPALQEIKPEHKTELGLITLCIIILKNGFKVEGVSACVDPANYDEQKGKEFAYENAFEKLWQLEGYLLKEDMYQVQQTTAQLADFQLDGCESGACKL